MDEIWRMATKGELLNSEGWSQASAFYTKPKPFPGNHTVLVMSNDWGPAYDYRAKDENGDVGLGYIDMGKIDAELRYTPPAKTEFIKTAVLYHMVAVPAYSVMHSANGSMEKKPLGSRFWQVEGSLDTPWTTVNTAVRYVLEQRQKTSDPNIRKNADETLASLLKLH